MRPKSDSWVWDAHGIEVPGFLPDGNGGLIVTENNTCYPNQANPMSIVDLDPATGDWTTLVTAAGVMGPSGPLYCYPDTIKALEPQIAVRGDGSIIISAMTNNGLPPLTIATRSTGCRHR